jgi:hypothetical protein
VELEKRRDPNWSKARTRRIGYIPESLLDAANVVQLPVLLGNVLLADGHAGPGNAQLGDAVDVVLIEVHLKGGEVVGGPLSETPFLDNLLRRELEILAGDVAVEDSELAADLGALELTGRAAGEGGDALRVSEGVVELLGGGAHLIGCGHGGGVHGNVVGGGGSSGGGNRGGLLLGLGVDGGRGEASVGSAPGPCCKSLACSVTRASVSLARATRNWGRILDRTRSFTGCLAGGIGVVLNLELETVGLVPGRQRLQKADLGNVRHTHLPRCRGLPRGC